MRDPQVLIIGAGPTGLNLALWLTRLGIRIRIIDKVPVNPQFPATQKLQIFS